MQNPKSFFALIGSTLVLLSPTATLALMPGGKPPVTKGNSSTSPPPSPRPQSSNRPAQRPAQQATSNNVASGRDVIQRGRPQLEAQKASLVRAAVREQALRPVREQLREQALNATAAANANPTRETNAAAAAATQAYMPVRGAHEAALKTRNDRSADYYKTKGQMTSALAVTNSVPLARDTALPTPGAPTVQRQARVASNMGVAAAASSPAAVFGNANDLPSPPRSSSLANRSGGYMQSAAAFKSAVSANAPASAYTSLTSAEASTSRPISQAPLPPQLSPTSVRSGPLANPLVLPAFPPVTAQIRQNGAGSAPQ
jgi:hypothetical protein